MKLFMMMTLASWIVSASSFAADAAATKPVRLFILSGQSNMVGMDPDVSFTPAVKAAFPDDEVIVVKFAKSGQLIRMWAKDWKAPEGEAPRGQGKNGRHYDSLMQAVAEAMKDKPAPKSITFVWMQGEADANHKGYAEVYRAALESVLGQLRADLKRQDIAFILGRISDFGNDDPEGRPGWNPIRKTQVEFAEADPATRAWVDTDDLNGSNNGLHYTKEGYKTMGSRFSEKAIELIRARK